ncbi:hypothetical protein SB658_24500, partial [Bacillus sp. SIMBA_008]
GDDLRHLGVVSDDALDVVTHRRPVVVEDACEDLVPQRFRVRAAPVHARGVGGLPAALDVSPVLMSEPEPAELLRVALPFLGDLDVQPE